MEATMLEFKNNNETGAIEAWIGGKVRLVVNKRPHNIYRWRIRVDGNWVYGGKADSLEEAKELAVKKYFAEFVTPVLAAIEAVKEQPAPTEETPPKKAPAKKRAPAKKTPSKDEVAPE